MWTRCGQDAIKTGTRQSRGRNKGTALRAKQAGRAARVSSFRGACLGWADQAEPLRAKLGSLCVPGMRSALQPRLKGQLVISMVRHCLIRYGGSAKCERGRTCTCAAPVVTVAVPYCEVVATRYLPSHPTYTLANQGGQFRVLQQSRITPYRTDLCQRDGDFRSGR